MDRPVEPGLVSEFVRYKDLMIRALETETIDLSNIAWIYPTFLLPTAMHLDRTSGPGYKPPKDVNAASYIDVMRRSEYGLGDAKTSFIPVVALPANVQHFDGVFRRICNLGGMFGGHQKFRVMIEELSDNIYAHSEFEKALVMGQRYDRKGFFELCIADDGITIAGSLRKAGMQFEDDEAILAAVEGTSSKKEAGRGFGLGSSILTLTKEYEGSVLVVSGRAMVHFDRSEEKGYIFEEPFRFQGTLISTRMPLRGEPL